MHYTLSEIQIEHKAILLEPTKSGFFVLDEKKRLYRLDPTRYYTLSNIIEIEDAESFSKSIAAISKNMHLVLADSEAFSLLFFEIGANGLKKINTTNWHRIDVSALCYSESGSYLASGDDLGNIFLYSATLYTLCAIPPKANGRICKILFSKNERFLVYVDNLGGVYFFDIFLNVEIKRFNLEQDEPPVSLFFIDNERVAIFYKNSKLFILGVVCDSITELQTFINRVVSIEYLENEECFFVATKDGTIFSLRLQDGNVKKSVVDTLDNVVTFCMDGRFLVCHLGEPAIRVIDVYKYMNEVDMNLDVKNYQKVKEYIDKNSFLASIAAINERLKESWDECMVEAIRQIHDNNILRAHKICAPFLGDDVKLSEFNEFKNSSKELRYFYRMVKEKKIEEAYKVLFGFPFLMRTIKYQELQKHWQNSFNTAKKLLMRDQKKYISICEKLLLPFFYDASKKEISYLLIRHPELFMRLDNALKHSNFKLFFAITQKYDSFTKMDIYQKVLKYGAEKLDEIDRMIHKEEYEKAREKIKELQGIAPYSDRIEKTQMKIELLFRASSAKKQKDTAEMYELLCKEYCVYDSTILDDQKREIAESFAKAMERSLKGDTKGALKEIKPYLNSPLLQSKIAFVMSIGYINELISAKAKGVALDWEMSISRYLERFGDDLLIRRFLEHFKAQKLLVRLEGIIDANGYRTLGFLDSICVKKIKKRSNYE